VNACEYCGKPTMWAGCCTACHNARDPELQADRLVMACIDHPERAEALHQAFVAESDQKGKSS
jgi:hypothetical protein